MPIQIALEFSPETEEELKKRGFRKQVVYVKGISRITEEEAIREGNEEFFAMRKLAPYCFITTSFWGKAPSG